MQISVVIPLYNKRSTIFRALNSVFEQTFQPKEIIVVNDGSTDGSERIVTELNHKDIRLIHQLNAGVSAARNKGIAESRCEWIAFLDADDEWLPEYLSTINELNKKYPQCSVLGSAYFLQNGNQDRKKITLNKIHFAGDDGIMENYFQVASYSHPPLWSSAIVIRKEVLLISSCFPVGIKSGEDLLTWARIAVKNQIGYSLKPLSVFIQASGNTFSDKPTRIPQLPDIVGYELAKLALENNNKTGIRNYVAHWHKMRASIFIRLGMKKYALIELLKSLSFRPLNGKIYAYFIIIFLPVKLANSIYKLFGTT